MGKVGDLVNVENTEGLKRLRQNQWAHLIPKLERSLRGKSHSRVREWRL